ncbi:MAG: dihydroorotate dehydrogenase electron transfer subunit [Lachnospiraceae bacterium]
MGEIRKNTYTIVSQTKIASDVFDLWMQAEDVTRMAVPGQFVMLYLNDGSSLLPRPISICELDRERGRLRLVYRILGKGTAAFAQASAGDTLQMMGPLGNGFPIARAAGKRVLLVAGGIGIPPMVETAKSLQKESREITTVAGYRNELFLQADLERYGQVLVATEDGSEGTLGNVLDVLHTAKPAGDIMFACGPAPMLRALQEYAQQTGIECWISTEERMACGVGACLACVCKTVKQDEHSHVYNTRVCKEGPVFLSTEVII